MTGRFIEDPRADDRLRFSVSDTPPQSLPDDTLLLVDRRRNAHPGAEQRCFIYRRAIEMSGQKYRRLRLRDFRLCTLLTRNANTSRRDIDDVDGKLN